MYDFFFIIKCPNSYNSFIILNSTILGFLAQNKFQLHLLKLNLELFFNIISVLWENRYSVSKRQTNTRGRIAMI